MRSKPLLWTAGALVAAIVALVAAGAFRSTTPAPVQPAPAAWENALRCPGCNLLLVSIDTLRADRLGSYGYPRPTSPNIDALAARSLVFRDVLAQAATTAPSHRSMLSGRYVFQHRNDTARLPVMAGLLARAGYRTAAFVDGAQMNRRFGMSKGFETYFDTGGYHVAGAQVGGGLQRINPEVISWLEAHASERFFAFVHTYDVHCPYTPPEPYFSMFTDDYEPDFEVEGRCGMSYFNKLDLSPEDRAYIGALYDGGVRYTDGKLAEILAALHRLGLDRSTIVVITSDHGESLGERRTVGHNQVYDVQLKVPLILHLPSDVRDVIDYPAQSIDLLPTVLAVLGLPPRELPGMDLTALVDNPTDPVRQRLAEKGDGTRGSVRVDKRFSLVIDGGVPMELYDLTQDPFEETNLVEQEASRVAELREAYGQLGARGQEVPVDPGNLDERTLEQLRALGYTF